MNIRKPSCVVLFFYVLTQSCVFAQEGAATSSGMKIWFDKPAAVWEDALPVGNGRLGAMIFGTVEQERLQLNEESVWTGKLRWNPVPDAAKTLTEVRKLLFQGKYKEAEQLASTGILGNKPRGAQPGGPSVGAGPVVREPSYQTLGDLQLNFGTYRGGVTNYRRELDIENAVARVSYTHNRINYVREIFSSAPDQVLVVRLTADKPGSLTFTSKLSRPGNLAQILAQGNEIRMSEHVGGGMGVIFFSRLRVLPEGGSLISGGDSIRVEKADAVTILLTADTDYKGIDPAIVSLQQMESAVKKPFTGMRKDHISDYQSYFKRVNLDLGTSEGRYFSTDARITAMQNGYVDYDLMELYYQFGRYLLISSSRPGDLPANLQGLWADGLTPPWSADYHININIQMNYWLAGTTNLNELEEPFVEFIDAMRPSARQTAKEIYGLNGIVGHYTTNPWFDTQPSGSPQYGMWPMGIAWSCQNIWDYYAFGGDVDFLRSTSYPIMKEAAEFCIEWLVEDPKTGYLVSGPSISPENRFKIPGEGGNASVVMGPTMDHMIIRDLLQNTIQATLVLNTDEKFRKQMQKTLDKLSPTQIGKDGRLMEWTEEFEEPEPGHRHISHLYGLHPGNQITKQSNPELLEAARKTIDYRLSHGGGHTGWSRAWIINFFARLRDGDKAYENLLALLRQSTLKNLFDTHPPFQIDGNFGATAGITEMLLQSHAGEVELLPALPSDWKQGYIHGAVARGNFEVNINWENGKLKQAKITSKSGNPLKLSYAGKVLQIETEKGKTYTVNSDMSLAQ